MSKKLISIIIPTYNRPDFLVRACLSVNQQSYENIEIIIVDDNSEKSYVKALQEISELNFKYIKRKSNGGGAVARNTGIKAASGDYIAFLDDDDFWHREKLGKQLEKLSSSIHACHCGYVLSSNGKKRIEPFDKIEIDQLKNNNKLASTTGLLCDAGLIKLLLFDESLPKSQDWDLYLRIAEHTDFAYVREALYEYDDGNHQRITNNMVNEPIDIFKKRFLMLEKHKKNLPAASFESHVVEIIYDGLKARVDWYDVFCLSFNLIGKLTTFKGLANRLLLAIKRRMAWRFERS